jgi:hypothetical protein
MSKLILIGTRPPGSSPFDRRTASGRKVVRIVVRHIIMRATLAVLVPTTPPAAGVAALDTRTSLSPLHGPPSTSSIGPNPLVPRVIYYLAAATANALV